MQRRLYLYPIPLKSVFLINERSYIMFRFGIMRDVMEDVVNLETGLVSQVAVSTQFIVCVDLDTGEAYWEGAKKTPFQMGESLLAWCKDQ